MANFNRFGKDISSNIDVSFLKSKSFKMFPTQINKLLFGLLIITYYKNTRMCTPENMKVNDVDIKNF